MLCFSKLCIAILISATSWSSKERVLTYLMVYSSGLIFTIHTLPCLIVMHIFFSTTEIIGFYKVQCDIFNYSFIPLKEVACNSQFYSCEQLCLRCVNTLHAEVAKRYTNFTIRLLNFEWKITMVTIIVRIIRFIEVDKTWKIRYLFKKNNFYPTNYNYTRTDRGRCRVRKIGEVG